jgi:hypothetical protein
MNHSTCDLCGQELRQGDAVRYEVKIEIKAAYDPLNVTAEELEQDFRAEYEKLLRQLENISAEEAQAQVYQVLEFDLCPACRRSYVASPLKRESVGGHEVENPITGALQDL